MRKPKQRPLELKLEKLRHVVDNIGDRVAEHMASGKLRPFVGVRGHATLMHDKLQRYLETDKDGERELFDLAVDAVVAVYLVSPDVDAMPKDDAAEILSRLTVNTLGIDDDDEAVLTLRPEVTDAT